MHLNYPRPESNSSKRHWERERPREPSAFPLLFHPIRPNLPSLTGSILSAEMGPAHRSVQTF